MPKEFPVDVWKERIRNGQRFQFQFAKANKWEQYRRYYRHQFRDGIIPVNIMFSILRSLVPQVYFRNPRVVVTAKKPGPLAELNARIVQRVDNWLIHELSTKYEFKKMIVDNFFTGIGSGFVGYDAQATARGVGNIEFEVNKNPGMPWFLRAKPEDVVYPWGVTDRSSAEWVAMRFFRPVQDLRADSTYRVPKNLKGTMTPMRTHPEGTQPADRPGHVEIAKDVEWVEVWQIHDLRSEQVMALTMEHNDFLRKDKDDSQVEGLPVETLVFNPDPDFLYGVPDARIVEPQLLELNDIRTQAMKHRRVNVAKMLTREGILSDEEKQKLMSEDVQAIVEASVDTNLREAAVPFSPGVSGILQDLAMQGELVRQDVREQVGFSRNAQGEFQGKTHVSAEETKRVFQSLNIRLDERRDMTADLLSNVVRKWNQHLFTKWTKERVARIVGPDASLYWVKFTGPAVKDEYDYHVEPEEGQPLDSQSKVQVAVQAAEAWAKMNAGAVKAGMPVPMEIQKAIFTNLKGIDQDRLIAQIETMNQALLQQAQGGGAGGQQGGQSPESAVSPEQLAGAQGAVQ